MKLMAVDLIDLVAAGKAPDTASVLAILVGCRLPFASAIAIRGPCGGSCAAQERMPVIPTGVFVQIVKERSGWQGSAGPATAMNSSNFILKFD
jgi:hypothetical protein